MPLASAGMHVLQRQAAALLSWKRLACVSLYSEHAIIKQFPRKEGETAMCICSIILNRRVEAVYQFVSGPKLALN